ncbi:UNVERIFIED_CONTAM: hypothetical protein Slati_0873800 [Sesamum latifolium]|uniref:Uncharacterized protein n=1 Tax=Sesamum latifolium TaxID=2727402 RepID=A0AAW2XNR5_9LAMI
MSLGHSLKGCPMKKPHQTPVSVYVQKSVMRPQEPMGEPEVAAVPRAKAIALRSGSSSVEQEDKGKAIVLYNAFEVLTESDSTDISKGPTSSPISYPDD